MGTVAHLESIPHPPGHLFVGNLLDLDASHPIESLMELARKYGPIYELELPGGGSRVIVSGYKLVDELCDESRFDKMLGPGLNALAEGPVGRGLFNSLYRDTPHPFVVAMLGSLEAAQARGRELPIQRKLHPRRARRLKADQQLMLQTVQHIIQDRRASGTEGTVNDLLDRMLTGVDRQSGEKLDDNNIIAQCVTFLIAGHETTSGLLSFALYALLKNPEVLARAYDEVDRVLGTELSVLPTYAQVHQVPYVAQILEETLRLWPTAPAFTRRPYEDTVIGDKYRLGRDTAATILVGMLHRDVQVWGENPEAFDPDRFSPENRAKIPPNAYKPFGTGQRACIGRQFALQEATLVLSMLLQRFELVDLANYQLETKQALTIQPY